MSEWIRTLPGVHVGRKYQYQTPQSQSRNPSWWINLGFQGSQQRHSDTAPEQTGVTQGYNKLNYHVNVHNLLFDKNNQQWGETSCWNVGTILTDWSSVRKTNSFSNMMIPSFISMQPKYWSKHSWWHPAGLWGGSAAPALIWPVKRTHSVPAGLQRHCGDDNPLLWPAAGPLSRCNLIWCEWLLYESLMMTACTRARTGECEE